MEGEKRAVTTARPYALGSAEVASAGPYFVADVYANDLGPLPNFAALAADPNMVGCILKATQGVSYAPAWFTTNWNRVRQAGGERYGSSWFRGCYHFGTPAAGGAAQADYLLAAVARAGGFGDGDMPVAWDLEGAAWTSKQQVIDISSAFAQRIRSQTGKSPMLYTGATARDMGITDHMGFDGIWTPHLDMSKAGWPISDYTLWQYAGDGKLYNPASIVYGYPTTIPGWGATDMSVVMLNGGVASSVGQVKEALFGVSLLMPMLAVGAGLIAYLLWRHHAHAQ